MLFLIFFPIIALDDGVLFSDDGKTLVRGNEDLKTYIVPISTENLGDGTKELNCFGHCKVLQYICFPEGSNLKYIGKYSFYLSELTSIDFSNCTKLQSIGEGAFSEGKFKSILLPDSVTSISKSSFLARYLESFTFPLSLKTIPYQSFNLAKKLKNITFRPNSTITTIEREAFIGAGVEYVWIPSSVTYLQSPFPGCPLKEIIIEEENKHFTVISNVVLSKDLTNVIFAANEQQEFELPSNAIKISNGAFRSTKMKHIILNEGLKRIEGWSLAQTLIESIVIPTTISEIQFSAFYYCRNLKNVTFLDQGSLPELGVTAFSVCTSLTEIYLPVGLELIGRSCFEGCSNLKHIWIPKTVTTVDAGVFQGIHAECWLEFEEGSPLVMERDVLYSHNFTRLVSFLGFSGRKEIAAHARTEEIQGKAFTGFDVWAVDLSSCHVKTIGEEAFSNTKIGLFTVPEGVKRLEAKTFLRCVNLSKVLLPTSLTSIEEQCFSGCTLLESISIPANVEVVGTLCFAGDSKLRNIEFDEGSALNSIGDRAFEGVCCERLEIPGSVSSCGYSILKSSKVKVVSIRVGAGGVSLAKVFPRMFEGSSELVEANLGEKVVSIEEFGFAGCTAMRTFILPNSVEKLLPNAFADCEWLESFSIPAGALREVDGRCFAGCVRLRALDVSLTSKHFVSSGGCLLSLDRSKIYLYLPGLEEPSLELPETMREIGIYALQGCRNLEDIILPSGVETIGMFAFEGCSGLKHINVPASVRNIGIGAFKGCESFGCESIEYECDLDVFADSEANSVAFSLCPTSKFTALIADGESLNGVCACALLLQDHGDFLSSNKE